MRFEVPQFIDVEDKLFGPLTFTQFIYLLGGAALAYVLYKVIPGIWFFPFSAASVALGLALAFYKLNNRPFLDVAQSWILYIFKGRLYIWKRTPPEKQIQKPAPVLKAPVVTKEFTGKTVRDLAQNLDILDK